MAFISGVALLLAGAVGALESFPIAGECGFRKDSQESQYSSVLMKFEAQASTSANRWQFRACEDREAASLAKFLKENQPSAHDISMFCEGPDIPKKEFLVPTNCGVIEFVRHRLAVVLLGPGDTQNIWPPAMGYGLIQLDRRARPTGVLARFVPKEDESLTLEKICSAGDGAPQIVIRANHKAGYDYCVARLSKDLKSVSVENITAAYGD